MTPKNSKFFRLAQLASESSTYPKLHIGAVIVNGRKLVSVRTNMWRTHTKQKKYTPYRYNTAWEADEDVGRCHAEMDAIIKAGRTDLEGASIYVYRQDMNGKLAVCKPCGACMQAIKEAGIKNIYFTSREGYNHLEIVQ
jgi:deoxycytidylate deaminase